MIKKMNNRWKGRSHSLLEDLRVIPQEAVHVVWREVWRLRVIVVVLISICAVLAIANIKGQETVTRLLHVEAENREKDATIEKLQEEKKALEEKLAFKRKLDDLVAKVRKEAAWIDEKVIRSAAEKAIFHTTDPALYLAIGLVEAELKARVIHTDGVALGMHGLCPKDWHSFLKAKGIMENRDDYFDAVKSFKGSEAVLSALVRECGSLEKALRYYNGGEAAAAGRIPQSTAYAKRVIRLRSVFATDSSLLLASAVHHQSS